jgi:galactokinase
LVDVEQVWRAFKGLFGTDPRLFRAPGRVNLIGEHTDYNEGFVLPVAIDLETVTAAAARNDRLIRVYSLNLDGKAEFDLDVPGPSRRGNWLDYIEGVARVLERRGIVLRGANLAVLSDVPIGAGLSSSAALEVSTGLALVRLSEQEVDPITLALAAQEAEHIYVGAQVGIMDQFIALLGREGHALLIDCRTLEAVPVPIDTSQAAIVIVNTNVKHKISASVYNTRRAECESAVAILKRVLPHIKTLRDVSVADFEKYEQLLPEPIRRRCRHVVTENERTLYAAEALRRNDLDEMGRLMYLSHQSLRDDYEVSSMQLDALVEIAAETHGVFGARMTGGGFGGCTVNLVMRDALESFRRNVNEKYPLRTKLDPTIYITEARDGAGEIKRNARPPGRTPGSSG